MKQAYETFNFQAKTLRLIALLDEIAEEYMTQDLVLTVRQIYYQMVARGHVENSAASYGRIEDTLKNARLAGLIDWDAIEDRAREFVRRTRWESPSAILRAVARQYHEDLWAGQSNRVFVIVEKEALTGVLEAVCEEYDVPLLAAKGYPSVSVLREFSREDLMPAVQGGQLPVILYLGDHDPSGLDMTRNVRDRCNQFGEGIEIRLDRIALNMDQVRAVNPVPNFAKDTDTRFKEYSRLYGAESWELDALSPAYLVDLVRKNVEAAIEDRPLWEQRHEKIEKEKAKLAKLAKTWK